MKVIMALTIFILTCSTNPLIIKNGSCQDFIVFALKKDPSAPEIKFYDEISHSNLTTIGRSVDIFSSNRSW